MGIAAKSDMVARYGTDRLAELTTHSGSIDGIVDAVLETALDDATAEIESYVDGLYNAANPPRVLVMHACVIAWYRLLGDRAASVEGARDNYAATIAFLKRVRDGAASLGDETASDTSPAPNDHATHTGPAGTFTRDTLEGF